LTTYIPAQNPFFSSLLEESANALGVDLETKRYPDRATGEVALRGGKLEALLTDEGELIYETNEDQALSAVTDAAIYASSLPAVLEDLNLTYEDVRPLVEPEGAAVVLLDPAGEGDLEDDEERLTIAWVASLVMFLALALYGQGLLAGVVEEKTSRVVEVLLGTLRPEELLAGKVLGIVAMVLTQMLAAILGVGIALVVVGGASIPSVAVDVTLISIVFLILGMIAYSFLYATAGATVSRQSEAESAQMPISMILVVPYFLSLTAVADNPDGLLARVLSLLPPTAPLTMPTRVATGDPHPLELLASVALMFPWVLAVIWLAARVYASAILRSGPRVGLRAALVSAIQTRRD